MRHKGTLKDKHRANQSLEQPLLQDGQLCVDGGSMLTLHSHSNDLQKVTKYKIMSSKDNSEHRETETRVLMYLLKIHALI